MSYEPFTIVKAVANVSGYSPQELTDPADNRVQPLAHYRQLAMYLVRAYCRMSYPEIGRYFGRHHSTVIHAVRSIGGTVGDRVGTDELAARALISVWTETELISGDAARDPRPTVTL